MSAIRRPRQLGPKPRRLHEKPTTRRCPQSLHRTRTRPWARMPQRKYASNSSRTKAGSSPPSVSIAARVRASPGQRAEGPQSYAASLSPATEGRRTRPSQTASHGNLLDIMTISPNPLLAQDGVAGVVREGAERPLSRELAQLGKSPGSYATMSQVTTVMLSRPPRSLASSMSRLVTASRSPVRSPSISPSRR